MKKEVIILGIIGILVILILGCTSQQTKSYETTAPVQNVSNEVQPEPVVETPVIAKQTVASAMDWYHIAKGEALQWRTDAKLTEVMGDNKDGSKFLAVDGNAKKWTYSFVSLSVLKRYQIVVTSGEITDKTEYDENFALALYNDSISANDWVIDSTGAVNSVNSKAGGKLLLETATDVKANYLLKFMNTEKVAPLLWTISYFPTNYGQTLIAYINGQNGDSV